jgi:hypothetical protein
MLTSKTCNVTTFVDPNAPRWPIPFINGKILECIGGRPYTVFDKMNSSINPSLDKETREWTKAEALKFGIRERIVAEGGSSVSTQLISTLGEEEWEHIPCVIAGCLAVLIR